MLFAISLLARFLIRGFLGPLAHTLTSCVLFLQLKNSAVSRQYLGPFPDWWVIGANVKYYKEHGVSGIFQEVKETILIV